MKEKGFLSLKSGRCCQEVQQELSTKSRQELELELRQTMSKTLNCPHNSDSKNASRRHGVEGVRGPCVSGWEENKLGEKGIEGHRSRERGCCLVEKAGKTF